MYAIVEIAGQQFKVAKDQKIYVNRLAEDEGAEVSFDKVLLADDSGNVTLGAPAIDGALIGAKVIRHLKGDKVIVFKKKRRKGYQKKNGHRQSLTQLEILDINLSGKKKESKNEKTTTPTEAKKEDTKNVTPEAEAQPNTPAPSEQNGKKEVEVKDTEEINVDKLLKSIGNATKADANDLKKINGIGPAYEKRLNEIGVYTYEQISQLKAADRDELAAIDGITRDKIESEEWVKQAKALMKNK